MYKGFDLNPEIKIFHNDVSKQLHESLKDNKKAQKILF